MPLRITKESAGKDTHVRIDGWLRQKHCRELDQACESFEGCLTLDLSGLRFADEDGVRTINQLVRGGALLHGASCYIHFLLARPGD